MRDPAQIERYLPFVRRIAGRVMTMLAPPLEVDDLVSYGVVGLYDAIEKYRPEAGVPFESFAHYRVRGAMYEGISRQCPVSRHVHRRLKLLEKANDAMESVARDSGAGVRTPGGDATMIAGAIRDLASIYTVARLARRYEDDSAETEFEDPASAETLETSLSRSEIGKFLERLPEDQTRLLILYYFEDLTLEEIGERMGFKKSWACKLHKTALRSLRAMMGARERGI